MLSVSEQLQKYRAMRSKRLILLSGTQSGHGYSVMTRHPSSKHYFQALMQRWHSQNAQSGSDLHEGADSA